MTTATEKQVLIQNDGWQVVLVREHQRALPGEGGSDYKPVNVCEHLREIWSDGKQKRIKVGFKWKSGEMSSELLETMSAIQGKIQNFPKDHRWTLDQAICVLHHGLELKEQRVFRVVRGKRRLKSSKLVWYLNGWVFDYSKADQAVASAYGRAEARAKVKEVAA